ncbi:hypothetical protein V6N13_133049 [Hibiscus sabdariffa]|uniref:Uncharacterized protein n=1 Tax=Hibiscus sabdariffa TaxID=183260 RepID=A0ABR2PXN5_9ROSI
MPNMGKQYYGRSKGKSELNRTFVRVLQIVCALACTTPKPNKVFSHTEVGECAASIVDKSGESGGVSNSWDRVESGKTSIYRGSTGSDVSDESSYSCLSSAIYKPHKANPLYAFPHHM